MLAVRNCAPVDHRLERAARPKVGPGEALLKIDVVGHCGSDGKSFMSLPSFSGTWIKAPVTPGHEFFGTVVEFGGKRPRRGASR